MSQELKENGVYTTGELGKMLKISPSTVKRLLKVGIIRANKVGGQYRVLGKEILRILSPRAEKIATVSYMRLKNKAVNTINKW